MDDAARISALESEKDALYQTAMKLIENGVDDVDLCSDCGAWMTYEERAGSIDETLCPKAAFEGTRFPDQRCYKDEPGRMLIRDANKKFMNDRRAKWTKHSIR